MKPVDFVFFSSNKMFEIIQKILKNSLINLLMIINTITQLVYI